MKVLLQNYTTVNSTEPLYITEAVNSIDGCDAGLWNMNQASAFDMFDTFQPELFIAHAGALTADIVKYLSSNKRIECIFNITGSQQENLDALDTLIQNNGIRSPFFFTNQPDELTSLLERKTKLISIMHGADSFLAQQPVNVESYDVELGVFTNYDIKDRLNDVLSDYESYHLLSSDGNLADVVDSVVQPIGIHKLYRNYKTSLITNESLYFPQSFFDSLLYGNSTYFKPKYSSQDSKAREVINSILDTDQNLVYNKKESNVDFDSLKKTVLQKHTCLSRVKRMFSKLKCSKIETAMTKMIEETTND